MKLEEALKSGKRIRRKDLSGGFQHPVQAVYFYADDVLSEAWEIEEPKAEHPPYKAFLSSDGCLRFFKQGEYTGVYTTRAPWLDEPHDP